jgi:hypothetical protein
MMRLPALVLAAAGLAAPLGADQFSAHFRFEAIEFTATSATAFSPHRYADGRWTPFLVVFTDFPLDVKDVHESLDRDGAIDQQARRAKGNVLWVSYEEDDWCHAWAFASSLARDPRFGHRSYIRSRQRYRGRGRQRRGRVAGSCQGEVHHPFGKWTASFGASFDDVVPSDPPPPPPDAEGPLSPAPAAALQAFITAVAARDLETVRRHLSQDQWPRDDQSLDAYFGWLARAYPSEAVVTHTLVRPSAARLDIEGRKDGRRVKGPVNLRKVDGLWKVTDAPLTWLEWPWTTQR